MLHHKVHCNAAEQFWDGLRRGVATIEAVGLADLEVAWEIGNAWRDQDFSIAKTSIAVEQVPLIRYPGFPVGSCEVG
jgi:hypothetical protein